MTTRPHPAPIPLILGTRNPKKLRELAQLIDPPWEPNPRLSRLSVRSLDGWPDLPDVVEDAETFAGNARKKAGEIAKRLGLWVLADDSGLTVDALGGAPGVLSARYAGAHGDDEANNRKLLRGWRTCPTTVEAPRSSARWRWPTPPARSGSRPRGPVAAGSPTSRAARTASDTIRSS